MNDQHLNPTEFDTALRAWMQEAPTEQPDRSRVVSDVVRQLGSKRRRRRRWWAVPVFHRTASSDPQETPERLFMSIPVRNDRRPTITGRTQSMFSPASALTAGALVLALGGALLIAQPLDRSGGAPGALTADASMAADDAGAAWVTGTVTFAPSCTGPTTTTEDGILRQRDFRCSPQRWVSDDPRFTGTGTVAHSSDAYDVGGTSYQVIASAFEVRNDAGGWHCTNADALDARTSLYDASMQMFRMTCVGDGDYAGTTAILVVDFMSVPRTFEGLAFPGEVPPFPATSPAA